MPEPEGLPELSDEEKAAVMEAIRSVAYFECVHESVESACEAKGEEIMQGMCDKEEDFLSGWNLSVEALDNLGGEIPNPLLVYFPESGLAAKPGQVVFTENVRDNIHYKIFSTLNILLPTFSDGRATHVPLGGRP